MDKTIIKDGVEFHEGYYIASRNLSSIEGKLLTVAELLGLPEKQSEALKSEIRQIIWGRGFLSYGLQVSPEAAWELYKSLGKTNENSRQGETDSPNIPS